MSTTTGKLFVVSAPSGAGKTSLVNALVASLSEASVAISHTTRPCRPDEIDGVNYYFVGTEEFERIRDANGFLESATVFGNLYGTSRAEVERLNAMGRHVILEIDWQGAQQIRRAFPEVVTIFILPPSLATLKGRLQARAQDDPQTITRRMEAAISEISHFDEFDYIVVNDDFDTALAELARIVRGDAADLSLRRQREALSPLLTELLPSP